MNVFGVVCAIALGAKWVVEVWLERLNQQHVRAHSQSVPEAFRNVIDPATYTKSVDYTLAKSRFRLLHLAWDTLLLAAVLFSGVLPWFYDEFHHTFGFGVLASAGFIVATAIVLSIPDLPWGWYAQFKLEQRFGFNTTTPKTWWTDRVKGLALGIALGFPLLLLILKLVDWLGAMWWLWAWGCVVAFQLVMMVVAPILILPLFNKFAPLPTGPLRDRLLGLANRLDFAAKDLQVMDGSKRSRHSNAFFTGLGRFRKIVLFDTLVDQLQPTELEAVLAHEIGHYKRRHIPKMITWSTLGMLIGFWALSMLADQNWFYRAFGFQNRDISVALLLFGLLAGIFTFWLAPVANWWSRRYEYEADGFAASATGNAQSLIGALRKLNEKNLSNLTPHPFYSGFYYSHPTLLEREQALIPAELPKVEFRRNN